jgi:hypothetical protein
MLEILEVRLKNHHETIVPDLSFRDLYDSVINERNIVVLKAAFEYHFLEKLRFDVFQWGKSKKNHGIDYAGKSFCRIDNLHSNSITPHIFHAYNFDLPDSSLNHQLEKDLIKLYGPMNKLQHAVSFYNRRYESSGSLKPRLRPQIIHYPCGAGKFDYHTHPFEPQKIGLILNMSKKGVDYDNGGTSFFYKSKEISLNDCHDIGDIALFRYDLLHSVENVSLNSTHFEQTEIKGKWSAILPLF